MSLARSPSTGSNLGSQTSQTTPNVVLRSLGGKGLDQILVLEIRKQVDGREAINPVLQLASIGTSIFHVPEAYQFWLFLILGGL